MTEKDGVCANSETDELIAYHLDELKLASDSSHPRFLLPEFTQEHETILDLGCGIGQTFVASKINRSNPRLLVGIDIDYKALSYGRNKFDNINFVNATAENLPLRSAQFDLVVSRVTLPYTNIPEALREISRVLKPGGEIWITFHTAKVLLNPLFKNFRKLGIRGLLIRSYYFVSSLIYHLFGLLLPHPINGSFETFQTNFRIKRELRRLGFTNIQITRDRHFLVTATLPARNQN